MLKGLKLPLLVSGCILFFFQGKACKPQLTISFRMVNWRMKTQRLFIFCSFDNVRKTIYRLLDISLGRFQLFHATQGWTSVYTFINRRTSFHHIYLLVLTMKYLMFHCFIIKCFKRYSHLHWKMHKHSHTSKLYDMFRLHWCIL